jgi:hypothetical protein
MINQRAKMIQEINSYVDGSQNVTTNPALHNVGGILLPTAVAPIPNPQAVTFNPLITQDYKLAKIMEINSRLMEWHGYKGYFELGNQNTPGNNYNPIDIYNTPPIGYHNHDDNFNQSKNNYSSVIQIV